MRWSNDHKIALAVCSGAAGLIGLGVGYATSRNWYGIIDWIKDSTGDAITWLLIGAAVGAALIFAYRTFSN